jgi:hypothetical protein
MKRKTLHYSCASLLFALSISAHAQQAAPPSPSAPSPSAPPPPAPPPSAPQRIGGHVGLALPIARLGGAHSTHIGLSDDGNSFFTLAPIYGITLPLSKDLLFDFEQAVAVTLNPGSSISYTVTPGLAYNLGPVVIAALVGFTVTDPKANVLLIPTVTTPFALGDNLWFYIEPYFPVLFEGGSVFVTPVLVSGVAF